MKRKSRGLLSFLVEGAVIGLAATEALDVLSSFIYEHENKRLRKAEDRVRHHMHAYEVGVERIAKRAGIKLNKGEIKTWGWRLHKAFGIGGGLVYLGLRRAMPGIGAGLGLGFGTGFFLVFDELAMPLARLTPGPLAFDWKVHARGAVSHIAYGVAAETTARLLEA